MILVKQCDIQIYESIFPLFLMTMFVFSLDSSINITP